MTSTPPSIIFIIPYFGRWPFWIPFFIESCRANSDINWLLISDCERLNDLPRNVEQRHVSFAEYCAWVSQRLGINFTPENPYKLCDLKPAYGYLHEADIEGYDYWGFSDLDLIYGDLRGYFSAERLQRYKFFSTHERRVSGHLCLLRNEPALRELFWRIRDFKERAQDKKHHALDEGGFTRLFLWRKNLPPLLFRLIGVFNPYRRLAEFKEAFSTPNASRPWTDGSMDFPDCWYWERGHLRSSKDRGIEFPYLHFMGWKKNEWKKNSIVPAPSLQEIAATQRWRIDPDGFHAFGARPDDC